MGMIEFFEASIQQEQGELLVKENILKVLRDEEKLIKDKIELNRIYPGEHGY